MKNVTLNLDTLSLAKLSENELKSIDGGLRFVNPDDSDRSGIEDKRAEIWFTYPTTTGYVMTKSVYDPSSYVYFSKK